MKIEDFKSWLDEQRCGRKFNYGSVTDCAFASFLNETALPGFKYTVGGWSMTQYLSDANRQYIPGTDVRMPLPDWARNLASFLNDKGLPFTAANLRANLP